MIFYLHQFHINYNILKYVMRVDGLINIHLYKNIFTSSPLTISAAEVLLSSSLGVSSFTLALEVSTFVKQSFLK